jgi:hypothetical protein
MTLQGAVKFNEYFRCYVIGQEKVHIMPYDPRRPHHERYLQDAPEYDKKLLKRVEKDALTLCRALGYDINTVEFAVEDGVPYAIDFMNPAPDADLHSVGPENFEWIVSKVAKLAIKKAKAAPAAPVLQAQAFLGGPFSKADAKAEVDAPAQSTEKKSTEKKTAVAKTALEKKAPAPTKAGISKTGVSKKAAPKKKAAEAATATPVETPTE